MRRAAAALSLVLASSAAAEELLIPQFVPENAGLTHRFTGEWQYMVGGGAAVFDCNGDRMPDAWLAGGQQAAALFVNRAESGGALKFERFASGTELSATTGAWPIDIDSDGVMDLAVLRVGEDRLLRGHGDCTFSPANADWGFQGLDAWSTALSATWEAGADWPTLAVGTYIDRGQQDFPWGHCTENRLYRPGGEGGFAAPLPLSPSFCALSMLFSDWGRSGTQDLRVSNDREYYKGGSEQLWRIAPGAAPVLYSQAEGWKPLRIWGMGIAAQDITGDGLPEVYMTSMADHKLQSLTDPAADPARPEYSDLAFRLGVTAHRPYVGDDLRPSTGWHAQFGDVNNDGRADLFVAKGNVSEMPDFAIADPNNLLLQRADGTFEEAGDRAGVASLLTARGAALADFNRDGLTDLLVVNRNGPAEVWRNATPNAGNWIGVDLRQEGTNSRAIGAWVEIRSGGRLQSYELTIGGGHGGGVEPTIHAGLGAADSAEVRVIWPGGTAGPWQVLEANRTWRIRPDDAPEPLH